MDDAAAVQVLDALEQLVEQVGHVVVAQVVGADDGVQVGVHVLLDEVDLAEALETRGLLDVEDFDDVRVVEALEELDLAQGPQAEEVPLKGLDLLDGHELLAVVAVADGDDAVGALSDDAEHLVVPDVEHVGLFLHGAGVLWCRSVGVSNGGEGDPERWLRTDRPLSVDVRVYIYIQMEMEMDLQIGLYTDPQLSSSPMPLADPCFTSLTASDTGGLNMYQEKT